MPKVSIVVMFGVLIPHLASISAADGCVHPGGCVSCSSPRSIKGDPHAVSTLNDYVKAQLGNTYGNNHHITTHGDTKTGPLRVVGSKLNDCHDVAEVLKTVMGWTGTDPLGCSTFFSSDSTYLGLLQVSDCNKKTKIQDLVNTLYCLDKPNGCVSCPEGESGLPQADERALAALTDIVKIGLDGTTSKFTLFTKGSRGGPGIRASGADGACEEVLLVLNGKVAGIAGTSDLSCSLSSSESPGFILGCKNLDTIGALQRLIDGHIVRIATATTTTTATMTTTTAACTQLRRARLSRRSNAGSVSCSGGRNERCVSVDVNALNTLNCMLDSEGLDHVTVSKITNLNGCIMPPDYAHCQALSAFFFRHVTNGGSACNGDCSLRCIGSLHLMSEDCTGTGKSHLQSLLNAYYAENLVISQIEFEAKDYSLQVVDNRIAVSNCVFGDTSPAINAMTAFFLSQGLDVHVRCDMNVNGDLYMRGRNIDVAATTIDKVHRKLIGQKDPVPGQDYHIDFIFDESDSCKYVSTTEPLGPDANRNLVVNIQEVLEAFAAGSIPDATLTSTTTNPATPTRAPYLTDPLPLTLSNTFEITAPGCTNFDDAPETQAFEKVLTILGNGAKVHCDHDSAKQLYLTGVYRDNVEQLLNGKAEMLALPSTSCAGGNNCQIKLRYRGVGDRSYLLLDSKLADASRIQILANLNAVLGLEITSTSTSTTTTTAASSFPGPNVNDLQCGDSTDRYLATSNCVNVKTNGGTFFRASGGTQFLEEYFAIQHPGWKGSITISCWDEATEDQLHDIVVDDLESCVRLMEILGYDAAACEVAGNVDDDDDEFPDGIAFIKMARTDCEDMSSILALTLEAITTTAASSTDKPSCERAEYMDDANVCQSCPADTYQDSSNHLKSCTKQPTCGTGTKISPDSKIAKRTCLNCNAGSYQDSDSHKSTSCKPQTKCDEGKKLINASTKTRGVCVSTTTAFPTATPTITVNNTDGSSNSGAGQPGDTNGDSNNDNNNGDGGPPGGTTTTTHGSSNTTNNTGARFTDDSDNATANGNSSAPPTVPQKSSSSARTIVGVLVALILAVAVVGFILWRQRNGADSGGIPHISGDAAAAAPATGSQNGGVPSTYHNRMYNIDMNSNQEDANVDFGSDYAAGSVVVAAANRSDPSRTRTSTLYSIPLEDAASSGSGGGGGSNSNAGGGSSGNGDDAYGGVMYVSALNQNAPEYATAVEAGSTTALYSVVSLEGRRNTGGTGDGGIENHYDMPAPGERWRGPKKQRKKKKEKKQQQQQQQQQQEDAPEMLYDVAQHAGGGSSASQSAEYSHLAPSGGDAVGGEQNNMYDLGPQQRGGVGAVGGDGAMYEEPDSNA